MVRVELAGLVLVMVTLVVENEQLALEGTPEEQDRDTVLGYFGRGVTVTW
jgi:hypothetical protein